VPPTLRARADKVIEQSFVLLRCMSQKLADACPAGARTLFPHPIQMGPAVCRGCAVLGRYGEAERSGVYGLCAGVQF
jgi:hypothetical protein